MQVCLLSSFTGQFRYTGNRFTFLFRFEDLAKQGFRSICVLMKIVIEFFLDKVADEFCNGRAFGTDNLRTQHGFCLALENWFFHLNTDGGNDTGTDVRIFEVFIIIFFDDTSQRFAESRKMRSALSRLLSVYERIIFFSLLVTVCDHHFDLFFVQMNDRL